MNQLSVKISGLELSSPLVTASGTSGHSDEIKRIQKKSGVLSSLGAFVTKGVTLRPEKGNPEPRIV